MLSLLFAMDKNRAIGYQNDLPWRLPNDLKFFKHKTTNQTIVMGRRTLESMNGALPNRRNIVLTTDSAFAAENTEVLHNMQDVLRMNEENPENEFFIIGGSHIFEQFLPYADRMYMTKIEKTFPADRYFPAFPEDNWELTKSEKGLKDEKNPFDYYFLQYDRRR